MLNILINLEGLDQAGNAHVNQGLSCFLHLVKGPFSIVALYLILKALITTTADNI